MTTENSPSKIIKKKLSPCTKVILSYLLVNTMYWMSIQALHTYCAPSGFTGFLTSMWTSQHPMCRFVGSIHTSMDQIMLTWPGIAIGAVSMYITGLVPLH